MPGVHVLLSLSISVYPDSEIICQVSTTNCSLNVGVDFLDQNNIISLSVGAGSIGSVDKASDLNMERSRVLLQGNITNQTEAVAKVMTVYQSCIDTDSLEPRAVSDLISVLKNLGKIYLS